MRIEDREVTSGASFELLPCPECGCKDVNYHHWTETVRYNILDPLGVWSHHDAVHCNGCQYELKRIDCIVGILFQDWNLLERPSPNSSQMAEWWESVKHIEEPL